MAERRDKKVLSRALKSKKRVRYHIFLILNSFWSEGTNSIQKKSDSMGFLQYKWWIYYRFGTRFAADLLQIEC